MSDFSSDPKGKGPKKNFTRSGKDFSRPGSKRSDSSESKPSQSDDSRSRDSKPRDFRSKESNSDRYSEKSKNFDRRKDSNDESSFNKRSNDRYSRDDRNSSDDRKPREDRKPLENRKHSSDSRPRNARNFEKRTRSEGDGWGRDRGSFKKSDSKRYEFQSSRSKPMDPNDFAMVAKTLPGLEEVLATEVKRLGGKNVKTLVRGVSFEGDKGFMYKANLCLRTALRVLKPIHEFKFRSQDDFYRRVQQFDWASILDVDTTFVIHASGQSDTFTHSLFTAQKAKDAIVDQFREMTGERPNVDKRSPDVHIHVYLRNHECSISLDSSGESLHKRGYKVAVGEAPISEVLAAGLILLSGWDGLTPLYDPFCGAGTLAIEAALIAQNLPANLTRDVFGFMTWNDYDQELHAKIEESALKKARGFDHKIYCSDIDPVMVIKAKKNISEATFDDVIEVERRDFINSQPPAENAMLIFNPPYNEKLRADTGTLYRSIGDTLKTNYSGTNAWMITSDLEGLKTLGLRTSRRIPVMNGALECRFVKYELYKGTKKGGPIADNSNN